MRICLCSFQNVYIFWYDLLFSLSRFAHTYMCMSNSSQDMCVCVPNTLVHQISSTVYGCIWLHLCPQLGLDIYIYIDIYVFVWYWYMCITTVNTCVCFAFALLTYKVYHLLLITWFALQSSAPFGQPSPKAFSKALPWPAFCCSCWAEVTQPRGGAKNEPIYGGYLTKMGTPQMDGLLLNMTNTWWFFLGHPF